MEDDPKEPQVPGGVGEPDWDKPLPEETPVPSKSEAVDLLLQGALFETPVEDELFPATVESPVPSYTLNAGQTNALETLVDAIRHRREKRLQKFVLIGYAGTGKTFSINRVVEAIRKEYKFITFGMTAPTHKAVRQLKKHSELKEGIDFGTIHSFLGLKEVMVKHPKKPGKMMVTYKIDWESSQDRRIDHIDVLIIDESSMLRNDLYEHIDDVCKKRPNMIVIFMGDPLQIPPVMEDWELQEGMSSDAIPFIAEQQYSREIKKIELHEIVRQKEGNPIIEYATAIRRQYRRPTIDFEIPEDNETETGLQHIGLGQSGLAKLRDLFSRYFDTLAFRNDPDYIKVVAYRNTTVNYFNGEIRAIIHKSTDLPKLLKGEKIVMNKPLIRGERVVIPNNEELEVLDVEVQDTVLPYKWIEADGVYDSISEERGTRDPRRTLPVKIYKCTVCPPDGKRQVISVLHEDFQEAYDDLKASFERQAKLLARSSNDPFDSKEMWRQFFKFGENLAWVVYNYAVTCHKSQGSTYDYCISMEWDINTRWNVEERNRIRYVAATRARNKLYIVK